MSASTFTMLVFAVALNAAAQLLLKASVSPLGGLTLRPDLLADTVLRVVQQVPILGGLALYLVSVFVWIVGLSRVDVSLAYPMLSLGYVVNALAATLLFGEHIGTNRWAGMALILCGVFVMTRR